MELLGEKFRRIDFEVCRKLSLAEKAPLAWVHETERLANEAFAQLINSEKRFRAWDMVWENRSMELLGEKLRPCYFMAF